MTIFENIKSKNIDEFAEWLDKYGMFDNSPWMNWWDKNYCKNCEHETARLVDTGREMEFAWCELHDKCKFFQNMDSIPDNKQIIKMWLETEETNYK